MSELHRSGDKEETRIVEKIAEAIKQIRYGSVEITIHDSRVVQIEKKEKMRLTFS